MLRLALLGASLLLAGCATVQGYEGERRGRDEVARIRGDYRITAGAPVTVILRQVDGRTLRANEIAIEVLPGEHRLLVDCRIAETDSISRLAVQAEVFAGRSYRFSATTSAGLRECASVDLVEVR